MRFRGIQGQDRLFLIQYRMLVSSLTICPKNAFSFFTIFSKFCARNNPSKSNIICSGSMMSVVLFCCSRPQVSKIWSRSCRNNFMSNKSIKSISNSTCTNLTSVFSAL